MPAAATRRLDDEGEGHKDVMLCLICRAKRDAGVIPTMAGSAGACEHFLECPGAVHGAAGVEWVTLINASGNGECDHPKCPWIFNKYRAFFTDDIGAVFHPSGAPRIVAVLSTAQNKVFRFQQNRNLGLTGDQPMPSIYGSRAYSLRMSERRFGFFEAEGQPVQPEDMPQGQANFRDIFGFHINGRLIWTDRPDEDMFIRK
ncbi:hypothetical protein CALCODRAFT_11513 [Calocera cornea HHB12733]|uniref:Uncharacterized protein n=1 Tax=Calocera cornea HHB12733 TaxID=1353952 RepID=A0A165J7L0_9BASI|nr:hypothetical protein CALCODRAFT_11513 [Calocera cornea HHB12733]